MDKEFYVVQGDFYTKGKYGERGLQPFDIEKAIKEQPDYVVFNGHVGAIAGDKALKAKVGETVRMYVGNGGPNLVSSFHVIGEIFDNVHVEGGDLINKNIQTTRFRPAAQPLSTSSSMCPAATRWLTTRFSVPSIKAHLGQLVVEGPEDKEIFSGKIGDTVYQPEGGAIQTVPLSASEAARCGSRPRQAASKEDQIKLGKAVYESNCLACHQANGQGVEGAFPPLAKSDYLAADTKRGIHAVLRGVSGKITVNGKEYNSVMPAVALNDEQTANVLTYILNSWGNAGGQVTPAEVATERKAK